MKHFVYILTVILTFTLFTSCGHSPERTLKKLVAENYEPHGFTGFEEYQSIRLCDEVEQQIKVMNTKLNWDKSFSAAYKENLDGVVETTIPKDEVLSNYFFYNIEVKKDEDILDYLKKVHKLYPGKYYEVSYTIYRISYLGKDKDGNVIHDRCYGKFDNDGVLVAYRMSDTAEWKVTYKGETTSIPKYREMLLQ